MLFLKSLNLHTKSLNTQIFLPKNIGRLLLHRDCYIKECKNFAHVKYKY